MVTVRKIIKLIAVMLLFSLVIISISNAEEMLIKGEAKYLGWRTGLDEFTTCYKNVIQIGTGYIQTTNSKCPYPPGISPIARKSINGKVVEIHTNDRKFTIKDDKSGKLYTLYYPNLSENIKYGDEISVIVPIEGRAEQIKLHNKEIDIGRLLMASFDLMEKGKYTDARKILEQVLQIDPGNPLALNNLAAMMVKEKKFDKADTYLKQALPRARGYMVEINRVCQVGGICMAFKPAIGSTGNQELEPLIKLNIDMVKQYMRSEPLPGLGAR
jgi:tetratricopeptide (TPR) repeat protein